MLSFRLFKRLTVRSFFFVFVGTTLLFGGFQNCSNQGFITQSSSTARLSQEAIVGITLSGTILINLVNQMPSGLPSGLVLKNGANQLAVAAGSTTWVFPQTQSVDGTYSVTVASNPIGLTCSVLNGSGVFGNSSVTNVQVACSDSSYSVGGTLSGLSSGVVSLSNGLDSINLAANGSFTFNQLVAFGGAYNVLVKSSPSGLTCSVSNGSGIISTANVISIVVTCSSVSYSIGGSISGLSAAGLILGVSSSNKTSAISANSTSFTLPNTLAAGAIYNVSVMAQPVGSTCLVTNGSGNISNNITNVSVTCSLNTYSVGGTASGVTASGLSLSLNGGTSLSISSSSSGTAMAFTFPNKLSFGTAYSVTMTNDSGLNCTLSNSLGTISTSNITNIGVNCSASASTFTISGTVTGLTQGQSLVLKNGSSTVTVMGSNSSGSQNFVFAQGAVSGSTYSVSIGSTPAGATCSITNGSGTLSLANVTNVSVICTAQSQAFTINGTITGLTASGLVLGNGSSNIVSPTSGAATFSLPMAVASGATYSVSVLTQPSGLSCAVSNGSGTMGSANVTNISVLCSSSSNLQCSYSPSSSTLISQLTSTAPGIGSGVTDAFNFLIYGNYILMGNYDSPGYWPVPATSSYLVWANGSQSCWGHSFVTGTFQGSPALGVPTNSRGWNQGSNTIIAANGASPSAPTAWTLKSGMGVAVSSINSNYKGATSCTSGSASNSVCIKWALSTPGMPGNGNMNTATTSYSAYDAMIDIYFFASASPALPTSGLETATFDLQVYQAFMNDFPNQMGISYNIPITTSNPYPTFKTISGVCYLMTANAWDPYTGAGAGTGTWYNKEGQLAVFPIANQSCSTIQTSSASMWNQMMNNTMLWAVPTVIHDIGGIINWLSNPTTVNGVPGIYDDYGNPLIDNLNNKAYTQSVFANTQARLTSAGGLAISDFYLGGVNAGIENYYTKNTANSVFLTNDFWVAMPGEIVGK